MGKRTDNRAPKPFSHVAILLSCAVSSEFKQLVPAHKEHIQLFAIVLQPINILESNDCIINAAQGLPMAKYRIYHIISFAACPVCGFPTYNLCSTDENNGQE